MSDQIKDGKDETLKQDVEACFAKVISGEGGSDNWHDSIPKTIDNGKLKSYDGKSLWQLLRLIRNKVRANNVFTGLSNSTYGYCSMTGRFRLFLGRYKSTAPLF